MLLDDKGRLFGKINFVDFTAILLVVLIVVGVAYKFTIGSSNKVKQGDITTVYLRVRIPSSSPSDMKLLKVGDRLITNTQEVDSWIKRVELAPCYIKTTDANGVPHKMVDPIKKDIIVTVRAEVQKDQMLPYLRVGNQDAMVGVPNYGIKTKNTVLRGSVIDVRVENKPAN